MLRLTVGRKYSVNPGLFKTGLSVFFIQHSKRGKTVNRILFSVIVFISTISLFCFCHNETGPEKVIDIYVSDGTQPEISWQSGPAHQLIIVQNDTLVWGIRTPGKNEIKSPVKYGSLPDNAEIMINSGKYGTVDTLIFGKPLSTGNKYYIQIIRYGIYEIGSRFFTPE